MKNLIKQLEELDNLNIENHLDTNEIKVDLEKSFETKDYLISFRLEADILYEFRGGSYLQPPEVNLIKEEVQISEINVFDLEHEESLVLVDSLLDEIAEGIKDKIEY